MSDRLETMERLAKLKDKGYLTQTQYDQEIQSLFKKHSPLQETKPAKENNTSMELFAGTEIGTAGRKFRLVKKIGAGGMGAVWLARDLAEEAVEFVEGQVGKPIYKALKVVNASQIHSSAAIKKLHQEAIRTAKLNHSNIINVYGWHQSEEGWLFVEMEYLQGKDLQTYLMDYETGLSWENSQIIIEPIIQALHYAHHEQTPPLIHRDLKPANIYLTEQKQIKILDFGLAYQMRKSSNSALKVTASTLEYMPPEAFFANKPDTRQDVYSLACIIYELLTGEPPFSREKSENRKQDEWPPQPEGLSIEAWQALQQGMAYDKKIRTPTVKQLWKNITQAQEPKPKSEQKELPLIAERYTDKGDGTLIDVKTGLQWQRFSMGQKWKNNTCRGEAVRYTWDEALAYAQNDNYAGYTDWRLPTIDELKSLLHPGLLKIWCDTDESCRGESPKLTTHPEAFPNAPYTPVWSSSPYTSYSYFGWYIGFDYDYASYDDRHYGRHVRLVRSGQ